MMTDAIKTALALLAVFSPFVGIYAFAAHEDAKRDEWERKAASDCRWRGYRTGTVRCHGTGTPFDQDGGVRDRCVMVTTGYRMDGMTIEAGKWSLPRSACTVEWLR